MRDLRKQIGTLERLLGRTQAENLFNQSYLKIACEQLGVDVESFRKKSAGSAVRDAAAGSAGVY